MYCGNCGVAVDPSDVFCRTCGARFVDAPTELPESAVAPTQLVPGVLAELPRRLSPRLLGAAFATIVVVGIIAFLALRDSGSSAGSPTSTAPGVVVDNTLPRSATTSSTAPTGASTTVSSTSPPTGGSSSTEGLPGATGSPPSTIGTSTAPPPTTNNGGSATVPPATATIPPPTATIAPPTSPPPPNGIAAKLAAIRSSSVRSDDADSCGNATSYQPLMAVDGHDDTAWMVNGDGTDASLTLTMKGPITITTVGLVPGYAKRDACSGANRFLQTRRIVEVRWTFDGAKPLTQTFDPAGDKLQTTTLPAEVQATTVTITVVRTTSPGTPPLDFTAIAEVAVG